MLSPTSKVSEAGVKVALLRAEELSGLQLELRSLEISGDWHLEVPPSLLPT